ncbi:MAG: DUF4913 domain-containing protein [Candidatus Nanopelagicales bacterium]
MDTAGAAPLVVQIVTATITDRFAELVVPVVDEQLARLLDDPGAVDQVQAGARAAVARLLAAPEAPPGLHYRSVDEFVRGLVVPVFRRNVGPRVEARWSARWWESAEAIMRLEAMWRSWEALRHDPATGVSNWLKDHADHHLAVLMSPAGPFARSLDEAKATDPLPYTPPPDGLFPPV